jgi:hypothetical protein
VTEVTDAAVAVGTGDIGPPRVRIPDRKRGLDVYPLDPTAR